MLLLSRVRSSLHLILRLIPNLLPRKAPLMPLPAWLHLVEQLAPIVLAATPLAPIAPFLAVGIRVAEGIPGASGPQKLQIAKDIAGVTAHAVNAQAGAIKVDPAELDATLTSGINAVVGAVNIVHKATESKS